MENFILKLDRLERLLQENQVFKKDILSFKEACSYLNLSASYLYKLTSRREIPHFCPKGKKLYFKREELDAWLQQGRKSTKDEIRQSAVEQIKNRSTK